MEELTRLPLQDRDTLNISKLVMEASQRERISVWPSFDGGKTWPVERLVDAGRSGYSSLAVGCDQPPSAEWIYLLYKQGPIKGWRSSHVLIAMGAWWRS